MSTGLGSRAHDQHVDCVSRLARENRKYILVFGFVSSMMCQER
jgi:hypothetical protein